VSCYGGLKVLGLNLLDAVRKVAAVKIIFLDIDGVLNCAKTKNPRKFPYVIDQRLLKRLKRLLTVTGAKVVLSSTWRYDPIGILAAKHHGIPFIDVTPDMPRQPRCKEVLRWLSKHPNTERFIVIDDDDDGLDSLPLFQPSPKTGLDNTIIKLAIDYLKGKNNEDARRPKVFRLIQNVGSALRGHKG
jgi:hypothetical protein